MSWYNRKPRRRPHEKLIPYKSSPMSEKLLREVKEEVRKTSSVNTKLTDKD